LIKAASLSFRSPRVARALQLKGLQCTRLSSALRFHIINQVSVIGFLGKAPKTTSLKNGTPVLNFSVATNKYWTDDDGERRERTQWHQVVGFGEGFAKMAERLAPGSHVFVQGELQTREYDRTIQVPNGKKSIDHKIQQTAVEIRADIIRILDRVPKAQLETGSPRTENAGDIPD
jgi:single-strand DNA-binding protein